MLCQSGTLLSPSVHCQGRVVDAHCWWLCEPMPDAAQVLEQLLDRKHLACSKPAPYAEYGVGYEVVQQLEGSGLLSGIQ